MKLTLDAAALGLTGQHWPTICGKTEWSANMPTPATLC